MNTRTSEIHVKRGSLRLSYTDQGHGNAYLLLHGGAGPQSMAGLAQASAADSRAVLPVHPGFAGTPRPEWCSQVQDLADAYLQWITDLDPRGVVAVGNSVGGWVAAEMALGHSSRIARQSC
jgi:pimeloyl-ACP methyl ester carboxylesterase